jgi:hypothetical protein
MGMSGWPQGRIDQDSLKGFVQSLRVLLLRPLADSVPD